jgi:uncharacterized protein
MKTIDLNKSLYELTEEYPELIPVLVGLGFAGVANPEMRASHGKVMTIPDGVEKFGLRLEDVVMILKNQGFEVTGGA